MSSLDPRAEIERGLCRGSPLLLKLASTNDLARVATLWNCGWHDAHDAICPEQIIVERTLSSFQHRVLDLLPDCLTLAVDDVITGFASWKEDLIENLFVDASRRGGGYSGYLLSAVEHRISLSGFRLARLFCVVGNERALRFYLKNGWVDTGIVNDHVVLPSGTLEVPVHALQKPLSN